MRLAGLLEHGGRPDASGWKVNSDLSKHAWPFRLHEGMETRVGGRAVAIRDMQDAYAPLGR
jgi:hypothetical protein